MELFRKQNKDQHIIDLINDIKANGLGYVKSAVVANKIRKYDINNELEITWNKEERYYLVRSKAGRVFDRDGCY